MATCLSSSSGSLIVTFFFVCSGFWGDAFSLLIIFSLFLPSWVPSFSSPSFSFKLAFLLVCFSTASSPLGFTGLLVVVAASGSFFPLSWLGSWDFLLLSLISLGLPSCCSCGFLVVFFGSPVDGSPLASFSFCLFSFTSSASEPSPFSIFLLNLLDGTSSTHLFPISEASCSNLLNDTFFLLFSSQNFLGCTNTLLSEAGVLPACPSASSSSFRSFFFLFSARFRLEGWLEPFSESGQLLSMLSFSTSTPVLFSVPPFSGSSIPFFFFAIFTISRPRFGDQKLISHSPPRCFSKFSYYLVHRPRTLLIVLPTTTITTLATAIHQNHFAIAAKREHTVLLKNGRIQIQVLETPKTLKTLIWRN